MPFIADTWSADAAATILGGASNRPAASELTYERTGGEMVFYSSRSLQYNLPSSSAQVGTFYNSASASGRFAEGPQGLLDVQPISMLVNPNSIEWSWPKRKSKLRTRKGTTFYFFTGDDGSSLDILELSLRGSTGSIELPPDWNRQGRLTGANALLAFTDNEAAKKLIVWHRLYQLSREPDVTQEAVAGLRRDYRNYQFMSYVSPLFPYPLVFQGHWDAALSFTETADKPGSREYSGKFVVERIWPSDMLDETLAALAKQESVLWTITV